jgi:pyruvyltransferase
MKIRTYFWHDRVISKTKYKLRQILNKDVNRYFKIGNAGDIITRDIIYFKYGYEGVNVQDRGGRLLCSGSISHKIQSGDVICGIGTKGLPVPEPSHSPCKIYGLRGPITYEIFKKSGHDVSQVRFLKDPGLMIRFLVNDGQKIPLSNKVIFIPHYRERYLYKKLPKGIEFVDIDAHPIQLANKIQESSLVYSSSLHGIIFAHALNRPCVFIKPQTDEPMIKYKDYYASVDIVFPKPLPSIYDVGFKKIPDSPPDLKYNIEDFIFPPISLLKEIGLTQPSQSKYILI